MSQGTKRVRGFAPGRVEVAGNHCDHQHGCIVAGAVALGVSAQAHPNGTDFVHVESAGYDPFAVRLDDLGVREADRNLPIALVRGVLDAFSQRDVPLGGFDVQFTSTVPGGSGLSSSAAFELAVAVVVNTMFAEGKFNAIELAKIGKYAECEHFGKPCGLMDQIASACGGIVEVDFRNPDDPIVRPVDFDFSESGYALCLVDTQCEHSQFNDEFATIPNEMHAVARFFGEEGLRRVPVDAFWSNLNLVRESLGDRAALRAMHFFTETKSVERRAQALREGDMDTFLRLTNESGISSAEYLQNMWVPGAYQPAMVTLAVVRRALGGEGAARIHGGGYGGCIQAFVPTERFEAFRMEVEGILGSGICRMLTLGHPGAHAWWEEEEL